MATACRPGDDVGAVWVRSALLGLMVKQGVLADWQHCNESRFYPRPKGTSLKLSSAWPEPIVIGPPVARQHSLSFRLNRLRGSTTPGTSRRTETGIVQSSGLGDKTRRRAATRFSSRPSFLDSFRSRDGIPGLPTRACIPIPPPQSKNVWKTRRENRQECEKVREIFVAKIH
jgi:hypothetical protein